MVTDRRLLPGSCESETTLEDWVQIVLAVDLDKIDDRLVGLRADVGGCA